VGDWDKSPTLGAGRPTSGSQLMFPPEIMGWGWMMEGNSVVPQLLSPIPDGYEE